MGKHGRSGIEDNASISCMWKGLDYVSSKAKRGGKDCSGLYFEVHRTWARETVINTLR